VYLRKIQTERVFLFYFFYSFIHMCIYCLGHFSPLPPVPPRTPPYCTLKWPISNWMSVLIGYYNFPKSVPWISDDTYFFSCFLRQELLIQPTLASNSWFSCVASGALGQRCIHTTTPSWYLLFITANAKSPLHKDIWLTGMQSSLALKLCTTLS
jgi:hypothetical protein